MILLTAAKMPDGLDKSILATAVGMMFPNPENKEYFDEIRNRALDRSACESLFALALLYEQIRELAGVTVDASELIFSRSEMGKPYFRDSEIKFNISHSYGYVVCAISVGEELGVDVEASEISPERAEKLAKRYFSEQENQEIARDSEIFARKWTEKEAEAKFFGESVGNILLKDKNLQNVANFSEIRLHRFSFGKIPLTLCTKKDYSTIIFTVQ